jgi:hypothetical protein
MIQWLMSNIYAFSLELKYFKAKRQGSVKCPENPMLGIEETTKLHYMARNANYFVEYGSGGSTRFIGNLCSHLVTVESDRIFLNAVVNLGENAANIDYLYANLGPTKSFGQPYRVLWPLFKKKRSTYAETPWIFLGENNEVDAVFIDGRFRVNCFLQTVLRNKTKNYGILIDDYFKRGEYSVLEDITNKPERVGDAAFFQIDKDNVNLSLALELVQIYKYDFR